MLADREKILDLFSAESLKSLELLQSVDDPDLRKQHAETLHLLAQAAQIWFQADEVNLDFQPVPSGQPSLAPFLGMPDSEVYDDDE